MLRKINTPVVEIDTVYKYVWKELLQGEALSVVKLIKERIIS